MGGRPNFCPFCAAFLRNILAGMPVVPLFRSHVEVHREITHEWDIVSYIAPMPFAEKKSKILSVEGVQPLPGL